MTARDAWTAAFLVAIFAPVVVQRSPSSGSIGGADLVTITGLLATSLLVCTLVLPSRLRTLPRVRHRDGNPQPPGLATAAMALAHVATVKATDPRSVAAGATPQAARRRSRPLK